MPRPLRFALAWAVIALILIGVGAGVAWLASQAVPDANPTVTPPPSNKPTAAASPTSPTPAPSALQPGVPRPPADAFTATVRWVSDGDTIGADRPGKKEVQVRLIGIDAPETKKPGAPVECFGPEASAELARLLPRGTKITAALQSFKVDKYGRELWDIWLPDGRYVQGLMVAGGFARTQTFGGTNRDAHYLALLQDRAQRGRVGMWGACPNV